MAKKRKKHSRSGGSTLLQEVILLAGVIIIGLAVWGLSISYTFITTSQNTQEVDRMVSSQRALLIIEAVDFETGTIWASNPGLVDVLVFSCTIYPKSTQSSGPRLNIGDPVPVRMRAAELASIQCEKTGTPPYVVDVWYLPKHLYQPSNPFANIQWAGLARYDTSTAR